LHFLFIAFVGLVGLLPLPVQAGDHPWVNSRNDFMRAWGAINKRQFKTMRKLEKKLNAYPLYPYLRFAYLRKTMRDRSAGQIAGFMNRYKNTPLPDRLHRLWVKELARRGRWREFLHVYRDTSNTELQCQRAYALFKTGSKTKAVRAARKLWLVGYSQPDACDPAFNAYKRSGYLDQSTVWRRAVMAMNNNNVDLAKYLISLINKATDKAWLQRWIDVHYRPGLVFKQALYKKDTQINRALVIHAVKRIAREDVGTAWHRWQDLQADYRFSSSDRQEVAQYLAMKAAYRGHDNAYAWLSTLKKPNQTAATWRIRLALGEQRWSDVFKWIGRLPAALRHKEKWRYWHARSLQELGKAQANQTKIKQAVTMFEELAVNRSYFGFLAADRIGSTYPLKLKSAKYDDKELRRVSRKPGMVRARELYRLSLFADARLEWRYSTRSFDSWDLKLAALLAKHWGWYDRAIYTFARTTALPKSNVDLPYPMGFRQLVMRNAKRHHIDPAWIYGVVRQESAFVPDVKSHAGAMGLMQLMPATARSVSRKTRTPFRRTRELLSPEKNIHLGSAYMRMLLDKNRGNAVLATASYNAGNSRTLAWLPSSPLPADVWVETIPFNETRKYVARVLAYTVIFDHLIDGKGSRLSERMPEIVPVAQN